MQGRLADQRRSPGSRIESLVAHILLVPLNGLGHIEPVLGILTELVARGHRVSCPVAADFVELIEATGATPVHQPVPAVMPTQAEDPDDRVTVASEVAFGMAEQMLPRLEELFDADRPDLVVYDSSAYAGYALALRWGIPAVAVAPNRLSAPDDPRPTDWLPSMARTQRAVAHRATFDGWLAEQGIDLPVVDFLRRPPRCLMLIPRLLQSQPERLDPDVFTFIGPCVDGRPEQEPWPAPPRPLVLVSLGTVYTDSLGFFRHAVAALSGQGWHVVLSVGTNHIDPADLGPLPPDVEVHRRVPQRSVLRLASLFVTHAGAGSSSEAVTFGVPMIAVPQAVDQHDNAAMLAEAGLAVVLDAAEVTPDLLRSAAREVLASPTMAAAARAAARSVPAGGARIAVDALELVLSGAAGAI
jgi:MGT family glycosyltransferase